MAFCTILRSAADELVAVQVARLLGVVRAVKTLTLISHTLAATLIGAITVMGTLPILICRLLATFLMTLTSTSCTLTSPPVTTWAWAGACMPKLKSAAVNGSANQDLNEACMVVFRMFVLLGPSLHFSRARPGGE